MDIVCYVCGEPATCIGRYEGHGPVRGGCDEHCAHGNEDGWCCDPEDEPMGDGLVETAIALQEAEAALADERLRVALWSGAPVEGWERVDVGAGGFFRRSVGRRTVRIFIWEGRPRWDAYTDGMRVTSKTVDDPLACKNAAEAWLSDVPRG